MSDRTKLLAFTVGLAALFGVGAVAGGVIDPERDKEPARHADDTAGHGDAEAGHGGHGGGEADPVRGLAVAEGGLRLVIADPELRRGRDERLRFRIADSDGHTVRDFDVEHTKRMHLIVARRDLTGFQHLHPRQRSDGTWEVSLRLPAAGSYRVFADFARDGKPATLAGDVRVDGTADLRPLPAPAAQAVSDGGYDVALETGALRAGAEAELSYAIVRDGRPVRTEEYLGAGGHLVALRESDLAFLHVHPTEHAERIGFGATFPTAGRYRLFLQFQHEGRVHTVAHTVEVS